MILNSFENKPEPVNSGLDRSEDTKVHQEVEQILTAQKRLMKDEETRTKRRENLSSSENQTLATDNQRQQPQMGKTLPLSSFSPALTTLKSNTLKSNSYKPPSSGNNAPFLPQSNNTNNGLGHARGTLIEEAMEVKPSTQQNYEGYFARSQQLPPASYQSSLGAGTAQGTLIDHVLEVSTPNYYNNQGGFIGDQAQYQQNRDISGTYVDYAEEVPAGGMPSIHYNNLDDTFNSMYETVSPDQVNKMHKSSQPLTIPSNNSSRPLNSTSAPPTRLKNSQSLAPPPPPMAKVKVQSVHRSTHTSTDNQLPPPPPATMTKIKTSIKLPPPPPPVAYPPPPADNTRLFAQNRQTLIDEAIYVPGEHDQLGLDLSELDQLAEELSK